MLVKNKVAVITGAASPRGIGKATAQVFARHGARVAILDLGAEAARAAAADVGPEHLGFTCDVTKKSDCE
jgi:NAD(P)-dependent dehydrogenase (short-subunit alcohol dehydrogenase family)